jgi:segregation and condensation protein A
MEDTSQTEKAAPAAAPATPEAPTEGAQTISVANSKPEITPDGDTDQLKITLGDFEGPLDLLLYLIRQEQVNIYDIPVARIADELLDPRAELVDRLLEHEKFKAAAEMLWSRATVERAVFKRAEIETDKNNPEVAVGLFDLLRVFQEILARHKEEILMEIEREEISMAEMIDRLRNMVRSAGEVNLMTFFERSKSRRELVVAFLSVLELVRMSEISLVQNETFGAIMARAATPEMAG